jgi:hypothetical protein
MQHFRHFILALAVESIPEITDPDRLVNINTLGNVLLAQGKYGEAGTMHRRALEVLHILLVPVDTSFLPLRISPAWTAHCQGI